jgi:hypothetical protein
MQPRRGGNDDMNKQSKRPRISATDLTACEGKLRELQHKALASVQGGGNTGTLKYKYV